MAKVLLKAARGHGRSSQPWSGNEISTYADDLAELFDKLDLKGATLIGHSAGGGEVAHYIGRHGTKRVAKAALISAGPPLMLKTAAHPGGLPIAVFDGIRASAAHPFLTSKSKHNSAGTMGFAEGSIMVISVSSDSTSCWNKVCNGEK